MGSIVTIQMPLREEGVQAWRPVPSRLLGSDLFLVDLRRETRAGIRLGLGSQQPILIKLSGAGLPADLNLPVDISNGTLIGGGAIYPNVIPLPLRTSGSIRLTLELTDGSTLDVSGTECEVEATGEARFVEVLAADFDPGRPIV